MEKIIKEEEVLELIATRVPPGDNWKGTWPKAPSTTIEGLVPTLTAYMRATEFKGAYRLEPLKGQLYAIKMQIVSQIPPPPELYDLYGEY